MNRETQDKVARFKHHHNRKKELEAQIATEDVAIKALLVDIMGWAVGNLQRGDKCIHQGVRVERIAGDPCVKLRPDVDEAEIAAALEKKIPGLVVVKRELNREAILAMAANPENWGAMRSLGILGITVERPTTTNVDPLK